MLRTLTLTAVCALGLLTPLAAAPRAEAHSPPEHRSYHVEHHHHRYHVMYRRCACPTWECYGDYRCFEDAEHAACRLRARGFEVRIR